MKVDTGGIYANTAIITDRTFILSMEPLAKNQSILAALGIPLFAAVVLIGFFVFYLTMRSRRAEIATELSLGVPKGTAVLHLLLEVLILALSGAAAAAALFGFIFGVSLGSVLLWSQVISACCLGGGFLSVLTLVRRRYADAARE